MRAGGIRTWWLGPLVALLLPVGWSQYAVARPHHGGRGTARWSEHRHNVGEPQRVAYARHVGVIQCVAYARASSGVDLPGNAADWWYNAAGIYARGNKPEAGSVLAFLANGRMRLGHVAVVSNVIDSRRIEIDQAHWGSGGVSHDISVVDVSENNDWTAVRVELGHGAGYGSIYPTHGFIYPRPDHGVIVATVETAPVPALGPAPSDLRRGVTGTPDSGFEEVAEAPASTRGIDLSLPGLSSDAPNRGLQ